MAILPAILAVFLLSASPAIGVAEEPSIPKPTGYVSDTAGVMGEWAGKTETLCREIEEKTTSEIAVLTVKTTAPLDAQEYAHQVFARWKVGKKGKDNGVLILVAVDDRKLWIATGYGVEGVLPDGKVGEIRDRVLRPFFRQSRYGEGIYMGVRAVGSALGGIAADSPKRERARPQRRPWLTLDLILFLFFGGFMILRGIFSDFFRNRRRGGGYYGGYGGGGGSFGGFGGGGGFGGFGGGGFGGGGAGGSW